MSVGALAVIEGLVEKRQAQQVESTVCYRRRLAKIYSEEVLVVSEEVFAGREFVKYR